MDTSMSAKGGSAFGGKLSIIIPAHNEEKTIATVLQKVFEVDLGNIEKEIIVVNDGSSDGTEKIVDAFCSAPIYRHFDKPINGHATVIHHPVNLGKGAAIKTGLQKASGDYVIIQDADLEYEPADIPKLLSALLSTSLRLSPSPGERANKNLAVFGNRGTKSYPQRGFIYVLGAKVLTWTFNVLFRQKLRDLYTGYKLIPTPIFKQLNIESQGFEFEAEVACKLAKRGVNIEEVNITYCPRSKAEGKHIGFKDAVKGWLKIIQLRFK